MAELNLEPSNFGIVDTIKTSSQELIDSFLDGDSSVTTNPDDVKDINQPDPTPAPAPEKAPAAKEEAPKEEGPSIFDLDDIKEAEDEDDIPLPPKKKKAGTEQKEDEAPEASDEGEDSGEFNPFQAFSKELYKLGAFIHDDDEEEAPVPSTPEEFLEVFNEQVGKKAEIAVDNFIARFGEDYQDAFRAIFVDGVDPKDYFQTYNTIQNFSELDLSSESNQERVVRETLKGMDYDDEDIETEVTRLKNYGDLEEVAKKHHKVLVKKEAQKLQELTQRKQVEQQQQMQMKQIFAATVAQTLQEKVKAKEFDGIPVNSRLAEEVHDMLVTEKWKNSSGETLTDFDVEILNLKRPENHAMKVKVAMLLKILKQDPTLSTIKKSAITKQTNQLFNEVVRNQPKSGTAKQGNNTHWSNL